jgi:hypothetical protein
VGDDKTTVELVVMGDHVDGLPNLGCDCLKVFDDETVARLEIFGVEFS